MAASPQKKLAIASIKAHNDNEAGKPGIDDAANGKVHAKVEAHADVDMNSVDNNMDIVEAKGSAMAADDGQARMSTETIQIMVQALPRAAGEKLLSPGAAAHLALDSEYRLREIIQDSMKFMKHSKRSRLLPEDVNSALRLRNLSPTYGFGKFAPPASNSLVVKNKGNNLGPTPTINKRQQTTAKSGGTNKKMQAQSSPKHNSSGAGTKEDIKQLSWRPATGVDNLYFTVDKPTNLRKILECPLPPLPLEVTISSHWLAVNGVQPTVPQNPPPLNDDDAESNDAKAAGNNNNNSNIANRTVVAADGTVVKHVLSKELQLYFDHLRNTLFGNDTARINSILQSVEEEPGLVQVVPYLVLHVTKTVSERGGRSKGTKRKQEQNNTLAHANSKKENNNNHSVNSATPMKSHIITPATDNVHNNSNGSNGNSNGDAGGDMLVRLEAMMRLVRAMHGNPHFKLESYLHTLFPSIITCVVRRRLCDKPQEDHWALRDYSCVILRDLCDSYRAKYHSTQTRCSRTFLEAFRDPTKALTTHYGAIVGLTIFGRHVVEAALMPTLPEYLQRILAQIAASHSKKRSVRKFEFAKVLGAVVAALNVAADNNNNTDIDRAVQVAIDRKLQFNTAEFANAIRNAEKDFGKRIYPHHKK